MGGFPVFRASAFINRVPLSVVAIGRLVLGESFNGLQRAAAVAVIAGMGLSQKKFRSS